jgi:uncharacterized protein (DUF2235 family)
MAAIRRLAVCLDGTWNNRDDSTNVLHHFALTSECKDRTVSGDSVTQLKLYLEGVGTGPLDSITGGGFGFGLETNVRAAYNWLVQNFQDGGPGGAPADEIYIFGFSRGAFTARSLVGFISTCGLLRRGAPLTVNELWRSYCLIGRTREHHTGPLTTLFPDPPLAFRRITELMWDPWLISQKDPHGHKSPHRVPGQRVLDLNPTEAMLVRWSRRVKITYLGVYDTVGAVGWDALAIPGIRSRLALHHNMRPTTLIQRCRHALAIDEHRSSFTHTPFVAYIGPNSEGELRRIDTDHQARKDGQVDSRASLAAAWTKRIEQRWFVGAHSNVGGGYASNPLAQQPLAWLLDGAKDAGLLCEPFPTNGVPDRRLGPRDSFVEFATPYWTTALRAKRTYRVIDPDPDVRADRRRGSDSSRPAFLLVNINEQVDPSVIEYWKNREDDPPPNLVEYARRKKSRGKDLIALAERTPKHPWMGNRFLPYLVLSIWATLAAGGILAVDLLFRVWIDAWPSAWWLALAAAVFALVDWAESCHNFTMAMRGASPARRAFLDSIYWTRTLGVTLFGFGVVGAFVLAGLRGGGAASLGDVWLASRELMGYFAIVALGAGLGVGLGVVFNHIYSGSSSPRAAVVLHSAVVSPIVVGLLIPIGMFFAYEIWRIAAPALGIAAASVAAPPVGAMFAGQLLFLQLALIYFLNAFKWAGEPMHRAQLGSILPLQMCLTPAHIKGCLDRWCSMLRGHAAARCAMSAIVREALYRDIIGFIPVYTVVFTFGLWFGVSQLGWSWLDPTWYVLPLTALLADYGEDLCHLRCLKLHQKAKLPSMGLALVGALMTWVKFASFFAEGLLTLTILGAATLRIFAAPEMYGWRGLIALSISLFAGLVFGGLSLGSLVYRAMTGAARHTVEVTPDSTPMALTESTGESR